MSDEGDTGNLVVLTDVIRAAHGAKNKKGCTHEGSTMVINPRNGDVFCRGCDAQVSQAHALIQIAYRLHEIERRNAALKAEAKELHGWVPLLRAVRNLHRRWKGGVLLPCCPHCKQPVRAEELDARYIRVKERERGA